VKDPWFDPPVLKKERREGRKEGNKEGRGREWRER
jgi:hypothetical protein